MQIPAIDKLASVFTEHPELYKSLNETSASEKCCPMLHFVAGDFYFSDFIWIHPVNLVKTFREILIKKDYSKISEAECLNIYNEWVVPIWNVLGKGGKMNKADNTENALISSKGEFLGIFWILHECLAISELNIDARLKPIEKHK